MSKFLKALLFSIAFVFIGCLIWISADSRQRTDNQGRMWDVRVYPVTDEAYHNTVGGRMADEARKYFDGQVSLSRLDSRCNSIIASTVPGMGGGAVAAGGGVNMGCWNSTLAKYRPAKCTYISSRSPTLSICKNLTPWTTNGTAQCTQYVSKWNPHYSETTNYSQCKDKPKPTWTDKTITLEIKYDSTTCYPLNGDYSNYDIYANNNDECSVTFRVDNVPNEGVENLQGQATSIPTYDTNNVYLDQVSKTGMGNALNISNTTINTSYRIIFDSIRSVVPFEQSSKFTFRLNGGTNDIDTNSNIQMGFKKPFAGSLYISGDDLKIGTEQTLVLDVAKLSTLNDYNITNYANSLEAVDSDYEIHDINGEGSPTNNPYLNMTLNYIGGGQVGISAVQTNPYIDYTLGGKVIRYILSETDIPNDNSPIVSEEGAFYGVKILGLYQGYGKLYTSGQDENNSDVATIEYRNQIKKNVGILTRDMSSEDIKNGVLYIEGGNHNLSTLKSTYNFSTLSSLVIHNGNIIIDGNINKEDRLLGIILTRDDYNAETLANVFINPDVTYINAAIFTDGGFISLGGGNTVNNISNYEDTASRTAALQKQLVLEGVIVTRNTVGGALKGEEGDYILPGGSTTTDFDKAVMYDLDYVRRGTSPTNPNNKGYNKYPFVISYDTRIQTNPPLGFNED